MSKSKLTLIIDGNWVLMSRLSVLMNKYQDDELGKNLQILILESINKVLNNFPDIDNIVFVSDGGSWRTKIDIPEFFKDDENIDILEYKGQRKLSPDVNWDLVFKYYEDMIELFNNHNITTCRTQDIEGDDWCWYWSNKLNKEGVNTIIWSMDKDLFQLISYNETTGVFNVCWNSKTGLTTNINDSNDDSMAFFFEDVYKQNNSRIMNNVFMKSHNINYIDNPNSIVLDKIIRGDKGDNIYPIVLKRSNNAQSNKVFRVSTKDIDFDLDLNNDQNIKNYIHNLVNSKKYLNKINKSEENIFEHFKYNYKLICLTKNNYPDYILDNMKSYNFMYNQNIRNSIKEILNYLLASKNNNIDILESI